MDIVFEFHNFTLLIKFALRILLKLRVYCTIFLPISSVVCHLTDVKRLHSVIYIGGARIAQVRQKFSFVHIGNGAVEHLCSRVRFVLGSHMSTQRVVKVGLLFSTKGSYSLVAKSMLNGALLALEEANHTHENLRIEPVLADPEGNLERYYQDCEELLQSGIKHIIGCYTSSTRKEIIPLFEKFDGLLWYPSHYEGFESSNNVIYTGAAPNQHVVPLLDYLTSQGRQSAVCVGSNYIWAWENNRIVRETLLARGGNVLFERYVPVGETQFDRIIETIIESKPSFVFNTLIGTSAYAFFRQFRETCANLSIDQASRFPVASCSLSEPELVAIGQEAIAGHLSSSVYFSSIDTEENKKFLHDYQQRFPYGPVVSADAEASFIAGRLLSDALANTDSDFIEDVRRAAIKSKIVAPQGRVKIDPQTLHSYLTPRIGISNREGHFDILLQASAPVQPDPYLVNSSPRFAPEQPASWLRVVK